MQGGLEIDVVSVRQPQQEEQHVRALVLDRLVTVGVVEQRHLLVGLEEAELLQQLGGLRRDADREHLGGVVAVPLTGRTERPDRSVHCVHCLCARSCTSIYAWVRTSTCDTRVSHSDLLPACYVITYTASPSTLHLSGSSPPRSRLRASPGPPSGNEHSAMTPWAAIDDPDPSVRANVCVLLGNVRPATGRERLTAVAACDHRHARDACRHAGAVSADNARKLNILQLNMVNQAIL